MRAISICQWDNWGSCNRIQLNADRTSGDAANRDTSCCTVRATSAASARGGFGVIGVIASVYNAQEQIRIVKRGTKHYECASGIQSNRPVSRPILLSTAATNFRTAGVTI